MGKVNSKDLTADNVSEQLRTNHVHKTHKSRYETISVRRIVMVIMVACYINHMVAVGFTSALGVTYVDLSVNLSI